MTFSDDVDWDQLRVPGYDDLEPADQQAACVFPSCDSTHGGPTAFACHACGKTTVRTCLRSRIPAHVVGEWLQYAGDWGWVCPVCAWLQQSDQQHEGALEMEDLSDAQTTLTTDTAEGAPPAPVVGGTVPPATDARKYAALEKRLDEQAALIAEQGRQIAELQEAMKQTNSDLPPGFSAHVVSTWGTALETGPGRKMIRNEIARVFRQAELCEGGNAPDLDFNLGTQIERLYELFDLMKDRDTADFITPLHKIVVGMNATLLLEDGPPAKNYVSKAKIMLPQKYDITVHYRLIGEARAPIGLHAGKGYTTQRYSPLTVEGTGVRQGLGVKGGKTGKAGKGVKGGKGGKGKGKH